MNDKAAIERGDILRTEGNYEEAKRMYESAYGIQVEKYGTCDNEETFFTRINIAETCAKLQQFEEALNIYQDVRARAKNLGLLDIGFFFKLERSFAFSMRNEEYLSRNDYNDIEQYFTYYEEILEKQIRDTVTFDEDISRDLNTFFDGIEHFGHPNLTVLRMTLLAVRIKHLTGEYEDFSFICDETYQKCLNFPGITHPLTLLSCLETAKTLRRLCRFGKAFAILDDYCKKWRECENFGREDYVEATQKIMCECGNIFYEEGMYNDARDYFTNACNYQTHVHTPADSLTLHAERMKGKIRFKLGDYQNALVTLKRVFQKQVQWPENRDLLLTMSDIAEIMEEEFQYDRAMDMYKSMCQMSACTLSDLIYIENKVAIIHTKTHEVEDAVTKFKILMEKCKEMRCPWRHFTSIQNGLAMAYCQQGKYDEATKIYEEIIGISKEYLEYSADILDAKCHLGRVREMRNNPQEALAIYRDVHNLRRAIFHRSHPDCLSIAQRYAETLENQNGHGEAFRIYCDLYDTIAFFYGTNSLRYSEIKAKMRTAAEELNDEPRLIRATRAGNFQSIRYCLELGDDVNTRDNTGSTPLHIACSNASRNALLLLLKSGANYEVEDFNSNKPIDIVSTPLITEILRQVMLLFRRAKNIEESEVLNIMEMEDMETLEAIFNAKDNRGYTPLHWVSCKLNCDTTKLDIVQELLWDGADIKSETKERYLALHLATVRCNARVFNILLDHLYENNSDEFTEIINSIQNDKGLTLLHIAAINDSKDIVRVLLESGADPSVKNRLYAQCPIDLAIDNQVKELLRNASERR